MESRLQACPAMLAFKQTIFKSKSGRCCRCRVLSTASRQGVAERRTSQKLPGTPARTRFAPSPTGYIHLGSLRTALFNYLLAKATGGRFVLRIEDTDRKRLVHDAEERLYHDLKWAGLQWDEGPDIGGPHGPYKQSERTALYRNHADILLRSGHAYRCFCSPERLHTLAKQRSALKLPSDYDRTCLTITSEESDERAFNGDTHVIRLKMPDITPVYNDLIYGVVGRPKESGRSRPHRGQPSYEDSVLIKSDGLPTYHLANVVDDHYMGITHVIRATEWMSSTPKHAFMYDAFAWQPPVYAHVGLLQDSDQQKFSKRAGDIGLDIRSFERRGIFPEALVNYVALFGWSHALGDDFLEMQDLINNFDMRFTKGNTIVVPAKLMYLQKRYAHKCIEERGQRYENMIQAIHAAAELHLRTHPERTICPIKELRSRIISLLRIDNRNYTSPNDFVERLSYFFYSDIQGVYRKCPHDKLLLQNLSRIKQQFTNISTNRWNTPSINEELGKLLTDLSSQKALDTGHHADRIRKIKADVQTYLRWAMSRGRPGPMLASTMSILGRDITLQRLDDAAAAFGRIVQDDENSDRP